jgi:hypothetical protein
MRKRECVRENKEERRRRRKEKRERERESIISWLHVMSSDQFKLQCPAVVLGAEFSSDGPRE